MKKVFISLAVAVLAGNALELKAFKKVGTKAPAAVKKSSQAPVQVHGDPRVPLVVQQVAMTEAEKDQLKAEINRVHSILVNMAMRRGNLEDATTFYKEADAFVEVYTNQLDEAAIKKVQATLPAKK